MEVKEIIRRGYKKTKLGWIPEDWKLMSIDEITDRITNRVEVEPEREYQEIGIRSHGKGLFHKDKATGKSLGNKRVFWIEPDCFVVNIVFAWEQAVSKTTENEVGMIASHRFPMYKPKDGILDLDYFLYFFKTPLGKYLLGLASPGGAGRNKTLGQKEFGKLLIPIPTISEQHRIVDVLNTWTRKIEVSTKLIVQKKELFQALRQKLLKLSNKGVQSKKTSLGNVANLRIGKTPSRSNSMYWNQGDGNLWFSISDMKQKVLIESKESISNLAVKEVKPHLVKKGTLLMSFKLTLGKMAIAGEDLYTNEAIVAIYPNTEVTRDYLYFSLPIAVKNTIASQAVKGKTLNQKKLRGLSLSIPPIEKQNEVTTILLKAEREIDLQEKKLEMLKKQKLGLSQHLIKGKIRLV